MEFGPRRPDDEPALASLVYGDARSDGVAILGDSLRAVRFGELLRRAQQRAIAAGSLSVALTTRTDNPARHLYERSGFRTVAVRTSRRYERLTGAADRILMVKMLG